MHTYEGTPTPQIAAWMHATLEARAQYKEHKGLLCRGASVYAYDSKGCLSYVKHKNWFQLEQELWQRGETLHSVAQAQKLTLTFWGDVLDPSLLLSLLHIAAEKSGRPYAMKPYKNIPVYPLDETVDTAMPTTLPPSWDKINKIWKDKTGETVLSFAKRHLPQNQAPRPPKPSLTEKQLLRTTKAKQQDCPAPLASNAVNVTLDEIDRFMRASHKSSGFAYGSPKEYAQDFATPSDEAMSPIVPTQWTWQQLENLLFRRHGSSLKKRAQHNELPSRAKKPPVFQAQSLSECFRETARRSGDLVTRSTTVFFNKAGEKVPGLNGDAILRALRDGRVIGVPAGTTFAQFRDQALGEKKPLQALRA